MAEQQVAAQQMSVATMDPVTLAVLRGRLEQVADEMDATLYRSAFNPIIAEAHDACHGLYDAESGDTLVQGKSGLPVFVGAMAFAVRAAKRAAAERGGIVDGDTWLFNDPYEGGTHACTAFWHRPRIGTMWAAMCPATTTRRPPNAGKRQCKSRPCASCVQGCLMMMCWPS